MSANNSSAEMAENNAVTIRILYRGECPKLTTRGKGTLAYEFGVNDSNGKTFIRIAANSQGGTCSFEWIPLKTVEDLLANRREENQTFSAVLFKKAFVSRSANNHGYLAAILKAVSVIAASPEQPTLLTFVSFDAMNDQINHLKGEDVDLPDHVASELKAREERKQQRKAATVAPVSSVEKPTKRGKSRKGTDKS